jgi:hypothetical protein
MPIRAIARLLQTMLYARRFFPYYVNTLLSGIEEDGMLLSDLLRIFILPVLVPSITSIFRSCDQYYMNFEEFF